MKEYKVGGVILIQAPQVNGCVGCYLEKSFDCMGVTDVYELPFCGNGTIFVSPIPVVEKPKEETT
jgi:hypothetical protein